MLDRDLALLYGVETKVLNRAVRRSLQRFPLNFMFELTAEETEILRCQIGTSSLSHGGRRYLPYVFTEQGVAMLSTVLNSERTVLVNIEIMRAFVKLRQMLASNAELSPPGRARKQVR
jgi:ORF6N domain